MDSSEHKLKLQVGGTLNPLKHLYIAREDLENSVSELLQQSEYCNILSPRQVGKSSLMMKVALRLKQQGIRVASIDIAGELGTPENAEQWYQGFLGKVARSLGIKLEV
jgi:predicted AAA+ superfamily ATPase